METQSAIHSLRIIDANANRAEEGLRVVEEYFRFVLEDPHLTRNYKQLRHDLADVLLKLPENSRIAARETQQDVGTQIRTGDEYQRSDLASCLEANHKRVGQSLRCIEEYLKVGWTELAVEVERLRYRLYSLERATRITVASAAALRQARLYLLVDGRDSQVEFETLAASLIEAAVDVIQLRDKRLSDRELLSRARTLKSLTENSDALFIMNDRPDLAALAQADGVHLGQEELSVKDARTIVGPRRLIGVSTHSIEQARAAVLDGANYIGCGPTFPSKTKCFDSFPGVGFLQQVASEISLPAFAIGGIDLDNVGRVLDAGFSRIAVGQAVLGSGDPALRAGEFQERLSANVESRGQSQGGRARPHS